MQGRISYAAWQPAFNDSVHSFIGVIRDGRLCEFTLAEDDKVPSGILVLSKHN